MKGASRMKGGCAHEGRLRRMKGGCAAVVILVFYS